MSDLDNSYEMDANQEGMGGCAMFFAYLIIVAIVLYADVMFIKVMWAALPDGFLKILGVGGAITTGMSIITLVVGKSYWFRPGKQLLAAWGFTGVEVAVSILNTIVAYQMPNVTTPLNYWLYVLPATPFVALVGWTIIIHLDRSTVIRHAALAMQDKAAIADIQYRQLVNQTHMRIKTNELKQVAAGVEREISAPHIQARIADHVERMVDQVLTDVTGVSAIASGSHPIVDSTLAPASHAQQATLIPPPVANKPANKTVAPVSQGRRAPKPFLGTPGQPLASNGQPLKPMPASRRRRVMGKLKKALSALQTESE